LEELEHRNWSGKTDGMPWMQRSLVIFFKWINIKVIYGIMGCVAPFYMLFNHKGYLAIYSYFRKRFGYSPLPAFFKVWQNHYTFGKIIMDRFAVYAGNKFDVVIENEEVFLNLSRNPEGFLMISSHVGNYEIAGYSLVAAEKRVNALIFGGETQTVIENRVKMFADRNIGMIQVKEDMSHLFEINNALLRGEIISMPGDRVFGSQKSVPCNFLGEKAEFPAGPFAVAVQRDLPALAIFAIKVSTKSYKIRVCKLDTPDATLKRADKVAVLAQSFANKVEETIKESPEQWFNYYDFWLKKR
jgi:predicted LPLAT superfamily acyltransferase